MVCWALGWQLSAAQWELLTASLRLTSFPSPIQGRVPARAEADRRHSRETAGVELERRGLLREGRVDPDLEAALLLLHRPLCWVDSVWLPDGTTDQPVRVVVLRTAATGVCALQQHPDQAGVTLVETSPAADLAAAVVGKLPPHPPGRSPGAAVSLAPDTDRRVTPSGGVLVTASATRTSVERGNAAVAALLDQPHTRAGQIAANMRNPSGRVRRSEVLRWCDNPDGRYQVAVSRHPDRLTVRSCDPQRLGEGVQRLIDSVQPPRNA
jgi:EspG family